MNKSGPKHRVFRHERRKHTFDRSFRTSLGSHRTVSRPCHRRIPDLPIHVFSSDSYDAVSSTLRIKTKFLPIHSALKVGLGFGLALARLTVVTRQAQHIVQHRLLAFAWSSTVHSFSWPPFVLPSWSRGKTPRSGFTGAMNFCPIE